MLIRGWGTHAATISKCDQHGHHCHVTSSAVAGYPTKPSAPSTPAAAMMSSGDTLVRTSSTIATSVITYAATLWSDERTTVKPLANNNPRLTGARPRSKAMRHFAVRKRSQVRHATYMSNDEGPRIDTMATIAPNRPAALYPTRLEIIELGPGAASEMA